MDVRARIRYPLPSIAEITDSGFKLPGMEPISASNYDAAVSAFIASPNAAAWAVSKQPASTALFPCSPRVPADILVEKMKAEGLDVAFVEGDRYRPSGFMVTETGFDLSHHIAAAYIAAGFVPPIQTLQDALQRHPNAPMKSALVASARQHVEYCQSVIDIFEDIIEQEYEAVLSGP